jgi:3-methyladenine DNA glycosylase Tag
MPTGSPPDQIKDPSLNDYLEIMSKAVFQSGISWKVVDAKWPGTREAFYNFDIKKVAAFDERDIDALTQDTRVIRNYRKLNAIVSNAQRMLALDEEHKGFKHYLRSDDSFDARLTMLRKDFKFMGPTGVYYFLYVVGEDVPPHEEFEATYRK